VHPDRVESPAQFLVRVSALGPCSAWVAQTVAMRRKCRCKAGSWRSPTNCIQSAAKRMHSNVCFCKLFESGTAHLPETPIRDHRTASHVLSVAYATEKTEEKTGFTRIKKKKVTAQCG
jgi:hypothetical protein